MKKNKTYEPYSILWVMARFDHYLKPHRVYTAKLIDGASDEEYRQLLLETANFIFREGRYNLTSEMTLENFDIPEVCQSWSSVEQINALSKADRTRMRFFDDVRRMCYPLLKRRGVADLTAEPWCMTDGRFTVKNRELRHWLYSPELLGLKGCLVDNLAELMMEEFGHPDTVIINELGQQMIHLKHWCGTKEAEIAEGIEKTLDMICDIDNHLEVGRRLGMNPVQQTVYDMLDTWICTNYHYRQIDAAKEFGQWLEDNHYLPDEEDLEDESWGLDEEEQNALVEELDATMKRHELEYTDRSHTICYLVYDLLHAHFYGEYEDEEDLDEDF